MKKVLIVSHALELGGAERSLIGLLDSFDLNEYDVDLFLLRHEGELLKHIPAGINLLPEVSSYTVLARPMVQTLKEGHIILTLARLFGKIKAKQFIEKHNHIDSGVPIEYSHKYTYKLMPDIQPDVEYDIAISFLTPHYIVDSKVNAKKKIAWIHTDYSTIQLDVESEFNMWNKFDYIASISESVTDAFLKIFPKLKDKIVLIENILPQSIISSQAQESCDDMIGEEIKLLSIGRYCTAKNFDNVPEICKCIREQGIDVKWYIIGFGGDEELIKNKIKEYGMEEYVILLGKKSNPYPYINKCDIYVQPSRYEGKCVAVREAQMLHKPVVITNYATSSSQLDDGVDGIIVPLDNQGCANSIVEIINNKELLDKLVENTKVRDYSNSQEVNKIYRLI